MSTQRARGEASKMLENLRKIAKECGWNDGGWVEQRVSGDSKRAGCLWQDNVQDKADG